MTASVPFLDALGLALVHFLWQGFVIGAVIGGLLATFHDRAASTRYVVCVVGMGLLLAAPVITTLALHRAPGGAWSIHLPVLPALAGGRLAARITSPLLPVLPLLPFLWAAGVLTLQARLVVAWARANRLRARSTRPVPACWQREIDSLRDRLRIRRPVRLLESSRVVVPSVVGWLRPVVLMPASLATGLGADEIRALLAHELAHVRRHDYLVNLVQGLFESLLFFHPVTWWLSGRLREEREFCCDDVALTVGGGAYAYARTLSSLEEIRNRTALPVLSAKGGNLMTRILRILGAPPGRSRAALAAGIATMTLGLTLGSLMVAGCFRGENTGPATALAGPDPSATAPVAFDVGRCLSALDAAAADGRISPELLAKVRAKIERGEVKFYAANCGPGGACDASACAPGDCSPADCSTADCSPEECLDGDRAVCVMVSCGVEATGGDAGKAAVVELIASPAGS